jgi:hypothetical protein
VAGITDVPHHAQLVVSDGGGVLLTFCLGWPPKIILTISASQVAGILFILLNDVFFFSVEAPVFSSFAECCLAVIFMQSEH